MNTSKLKEIKMKYIPNIIDVEDNIKVLKIARTLAARPKVRKKPTSSKTCKYLKIKALESIEPFNTPRVSDAEKRLIFNLRKKGFAIEEISNALLRSHLTVRKYI